MNNSNKQSLLNEDIDLSKYFRTLLRNVKFISLFTLAGAVTSTILTLSKKEIWQGDFQIIATSNDLQEQASLKSKGDLKILLNNKRNDTTQLEILKSPSVLLPVFNYIKEFKRSNGIEVENLQYESWVANNLSIDFKKNTSVLEIKYRDSDKKLIKKALELISSRYQDYSKNDRKKKLINTKNFLTSQINKISVKSKNARRELNEFALENSLGPIDGVFRGSDQSYERNTDSTESKSNTEINDSSTRFAYHFDKLVKYEAQYFDESAIYKPNSPTLINLKSKIDNLKVLLRRPSEILIEYNDLKTVTTRLTNTLNQLENQLTIVDISIARQDDPWNLISEPKIQSLRFAPNRTEDLFFGTIISFFFGSIIAYLREENIGIIYELDDIKKIKLDKYLGKLYLYNQEINDELICSILNEKNINPEDNQVGILSISDNFLSKNNKFIPPKYFVNKNIKIINQLDLSSIKKFDFLITTYSLGEINFNQLNKSNDILQMFKNKMLGWMIVEKKEII